MDAAYQVHVTLGPGLLESICERALCQIIGSKPGCKEVGPCPGCLGVALRTLINTGTGPYAAPESSLSCTHAGTADSPTDATRAMTTILKKSDSPHEIRRKIEEASAGRKGFDARKFCGRVRWKEDALTIQKKLRSEWDERSG